MQDERQIRAIKLAAEEFTHQSGTGDKFERFERPGEYCMLPWIRIESWYSSKGVSINSKRVIEAPLTQVQMIEFAS